MDNIENIFDLIVRKEDLFFRGLNLDATRSEIEAVEGTKYFDKSGPGISKPHLKYSYEVGEVEEITVYYGFEPGCDGLESITLYFHSFPDFYWRKSGGENIAEFNKLMYAENIDDYSQLFDGVFTKVSDTFRETLGEPNVHRIHNVFGAPYQGYVSYTWIRAGQDGVDFLLTLIRYLDDSNFDDIQWIMKLKIGRAPSKR